MRPKSPLGKVCIVMMSAIGDSVHVLPVVTALKRHDPMAHITWILQPGPASLMRGHPDVDEILVFRRGTGVRGFLELRERLGGRRFDLVLNLQVYLKASLVTMMTRAPVKLGFDRTRARDLNWLVTNRKIPPHEPQHVQDQYFEFLEYLGVSPDPVEWRLGPWADERATQRAFFRQFERPVAVLAIGTSDVRKMWVAERWARLADSLYEQYGLQPVLVRSNAPREVEVERVVVGSARVPVHYADAGLRELVGIIEGSALVIGLNSAPMHVAVAVGTPVISLLGHVNARRTGPYRRFHDLVIDVYGEPGEEYAISLEKRPSRMDRIEVADVLEKVSLWRARYAVGGSVSGTDD